MTVSDANARRGATRSWACDWRRHAYLAITLLMFATVVWGFWPGYLGRLLGGGVDRIWMIHVHAAVFLGWMALLVAQASLVAAKNVRPHRRLGLFGAGYGTFLLLLGLVFSLAAPAARVRADQLSADVAGLVGLYNLTDMIVFGGFFVAAMLWRSTPALHRRLILCASIALTGAAVGRQVPQSAPLLYTAVWLAPLGLAMLVDLVGERRVHGVFVIGAVAFLAIRLKVGFFALSPVWTQVGETLVRPFI